MYSSVENSSGNVPAFLVKLWSLVEDPTTDELIHWDTGGTSFHVYDQQRFSREILPLYFKHNNIASFIRQLNMYGFRKVAHIEQGGLKIEKDDLQFQHQYFQKGERDMLQYIKRKVSNAPVRPTAETVVSAKPDEVSRVLTDVKQVKSKQESMDQNLEYIKRENKLLWREVALLRQKHHKQQQIVNKLIQFLVSLVSSSRTGLTIPSMRRMPLAINDVSQVQAQQAHQAGHHQQVVGDSGAHNTIANLIQENLAEVAASQMEKQSSDGTEYIIDDGEYTIESPRGSEMVLSTTPNTGGPIIHELTDIKPTTGANSPPQHIYVNSQGQIVQKPVGQKNVILTTNQPNAGGGKTPMNFLLLPQVPVQSSQSISSPAASSFLLPSPMQSPSSSSASSHSRVASPVSSLMSPKVEAAPSLEDALNFGLNVPPSSNVVARARPVVAQPMPSLAQVNNSAVQTASLVGKRRSMEENSSSPAKRQMAAGGRLLLQPRLVQQNKMVANVPSAPAIKAAAAPQQKGISPAQAASLNSLMQANSDLNSPQVVVSTLPASLSSSIASASSSSIASASSSGTADALALAAAGSNKDGDDPMLASDQLDLLSSDLDGLKGILHDQYKVDPDFLLELFDISNPWDIKQEKELEEQLKAVSSKEAASTSGVGLENITGQELVEYNPQEHTFPEELLLGDGLIGDIDDID